MSLAARRRPLSPAGWAHVASSGKWVCPPHLTLLNREVTALAARREGGLVVSLPPRNGKSEFISRYLPGWWLGTFPDEHVIVASYEADFASTWGQKAQDAFAAKGLEVFGREVDPNKMSRSHWGVKGHAGTMTTVGVGGALTGRGAHLLVADDLIKNAEDANSANHREKVWEWWQSTAFTRLEPGGVAIMMFTRWHEDDPVGRIVAMIEAGEMGPGWKVINLPALAEEGDPLGRPVGKALWPERFDEAALDKIRKAIGEYYFSALYQGRPVPKSGNLFNREWLKKPGRTVSISAVPDDAEFVRAWDKAASENSGDWTSGTLMARSKAGLYFLVDVKRFRHSPGKRDRLMRSTGEADRDAWKKYRVRSNRDPGQAGIGDAEAFVRLFEGFDVKTAPVTGDKETNFTPFCSQAEIGNVFMVEGAWNEDFLREAEAFPRGTHDDQCDSTSIAFHDLAGNVKKPGFVAAGGKRPAYRPAYGGMR